MRALDLVIIFGYLVGITLFGIWFAGKQETTEDYFVGDSYETDALAARAVGMRAILLDPLGLHPESVCPRIRTLGELINGRD